MGDTIDLKKIFRNFTTNELLFYLENLNLQLDHEDLEIFEYNHIDMRRLRHRKKHVTLQICNIYIKFSEISHSCKKFINEYFLLHNSNL